MRSYAPPPSRQTPELVVLRTNPFGSSASTSSMRKRTSSATAWNDPASLSASSRESGAVSDGAMVDVLVGRRVEQIQIGRFPRQQNEGDGVCRDRGALAGRTRREPFGVAPVQEGDGVAEMIGREDLVPEVRAVLVDLVDADLLLLVLADVEALAAGGAGPHPAPEEPEPVAERRQQLVPYRGAGQTQEAIEREQHLLASVGRSGRVTDLLEGLGERSHGREIARGERGVDAGHRGAPGVRADAPLYPRLGPRLRRRRGGDRRHRRHAARARRAPSRPSPPRARRRGAPRRRPRRAGRRRGTRRRAPSARRRGRASASVAAAIATAASANAIAAA